MTDKNLLDMSSSERQVVLHRLIGDDAIYEDFSRATMTYKFVRSPEVSARDLLWLIKYMREREWFIEIGVAMDPDGNPDQWYASVCRHPGHGPEYLVQGIELEICVVCAAIQALESEKESE